MALSIPSVAVSIAADGIPANVTTAVASCPSTFVTCAMFAPPMIPKVFMNDPAAMTVKAPAMPVRPRPISSQDIEPNFWSALAS